MKALFKGICALLMAAPFFTGCETPEEQVPVTIRLNKELISNLPVGSSQTLVATVKPEGAEVTVVWTSENEEIAIVSENGEVTGVAPGTTTISAQADESVATCKVTVTEVKPTKIALNKTSIEIPVETQYLLEVVLTPSNAVASDLVWVTSNNEVVTVEQSGLVTAVSEGNATITVKCNGNTLAATCQVKVIKEDTPENPEDPKDPADPDPENPKDPEEPKDPTDPDPEDPKDPTDPDPENPKDPVDPEPEDPEVAVKSVVIYAEGNAEDLQVGKPLQLHAVYEPSDAKPNSVSWTVDNATYAQIDQNGVITGVFANEGSDGNWSKVNAKVTADGVSASISLRVIPRQPDEIAVDLPENNQLRVDEEWYFNPRVLPEGLGYKVYCSSSMPDGRPQNDPYGVYVSGVPGAIAVTFAVSDHTNLVYTAYRKDVYVNVIPYWVESVSLPETQEMEQGASMSLTPVFTSDVEGVQPTYKDVKWYSSNPSVATINENTGEITALAAGQTNITVTTTGSWTVPGGQEQKSATCVLTVKEAEGSLNVGDYFYSDGTWSSELQSGKTVVGIVFAKANATTSDPELAKDFPGCTHGLVLGLQEYAEQDFGYVSTYYGHGYYAGLGYDASLIVNEEKPNGYGNSKAHKDLNASKPDYVSLFNAQSGVIATQTSAVSTPANASSWYIPSYREMEMIHANYDTINSALNAAGGQPIVAPYEREESFDPNHSSDWYWTSTIYGKPYNTSFDHYKYAFDISKGAWTTSQQPSAKCKVRVVFAF
jgi:uncharacterized protein YjdB